MENQDANQPEKTHESHTTTKNKRGDGNENAAPILGPISCEIEQPLYQSENPNRKCRWTNDPGIFGATVAGVIAVILYTSVAFWQACLTRHTLDEMREERTAFVTATDLVMKKTSKGGFSVVLQFTNSGDTPTKDFKWWMYWRCHHQLNQNIPATPDCNTSLKVSNGLIGPKSTIADFQSGITADDVKELKKDNRFEISGWLSYRDVMDRPHRTFFCYKIYFINDDELGKLTCSDTPPCADKECNAYPSYERRMAEEWAAALKPVPPEFLPFSPVVEK